VVGEYVFCNDAGGHIKKNDRKLDAGYQQKKLVGVANVDKFCLRLYY